MKAAKNDAALASALMVKQLRGLGTDARSRRAVLADLGVLSRRAERALIVPDLGWPMPRWICPA